MEISLVDNWLVNNALDTAGFVDFDSLQSIIGEETNVNLPPESIQDSYIKTQLHSESRENDEIYLVCGSALKRLFRHIIDENDCDCKCGKSLDFATFKVQRITKNNHCCKVTAECKAEKGHTVEWFSSFAGKYYANLRAFISRLCNILPKIHFSLYCFIVKIIFSIPPSIYILQNGS